MSTVTRRLRIALLAALLGAPPLALGAQGLRMPEVRIAGSKEPVRLQTLRVEVEVAGSLATTTWDMTVANPQDRVLEGELVFPLGAGQTVSRFALDVNGRLCEGVPVEKAKGRQAFEAVVRRGIDPGLLERTEGNAFRARVYPVPARGTRRIVLAYEQELPFAAKGEGEALRYHLPFAFRERIPSFSFRIQVHEQDLDPRFEASPLPGLGFRRWQRAFVAETTQEDARLDQPLTVLVPRPPDARALFLERQGADTWFAVAVNPRLPREAKPLPRNLLLLFDASLSAGNRDRALELRVLDAYFRRIGTAEVRLVVFRDRPEPAQDFTIRGGRWAELRKALEEAPADGATAFGGLDLAGEWPDEILLLSDGLNSLGPAEPRLPAAPLTALSSAALGDPARLRALAERSGGEWIDLTRSSEAEALAALASRPLTFLRASYPAGAVEELYPSGGQVVRGSLVLAGRLRTPGATLTLHFGYGGRTRFTRTVRLVREEGSDAPVRRLWAQKKLAELELDRPRHAKAILELGKAFGLVTEGTSLIVLEDVRDYAQYRIEPPAELRAEYDRLLAAARKDEGDREKAHLAQVLQAFQERQRWWETEFKPPVPKPEPREAGPRNAASTSKVVTFSPRPDSTIVHESLPVSRPSPAAPAQLAAGIADRKARNGRRSGEDEGVRGAIEMKPWNPDTPYLKALEAASKPERYATYLRLRETFGATPAYYLDVADFFERQGQKALARRILSCLAELKLEDAPLLRVLGWRLQQLGEHDLAVWVLEQVLRIREEEPQSRRDLGLALASRGDLQRAAEVLWDAVRIPSDGRFRDIHLIALGELNALLAGSQRSIVVTGLDRAFQRNLPVDVRVVLNWDTPDSDMDLHVIDPRGEECFYSHSRTAIGGRISADVTQGYGPEEFLLKRAIPGRYRIQAKFFGTRQQTVVGATTVRLELFLRYGSPRTENKGALLRLSGPGRMVDVGEFVVEAGSN